MRHSKGHCTFAIAALLAAVAVAAPVAQAGQGKACTLNATVVFSRTIWIRNTTGDIAVSNARITCDGAERGLTGLGYFGEPEPPIQGDLGFGPDTCVSGIEYLYLYAPGQRSRHATTAPLWLELTLTRTNTRFTSAGEITRGTSQINLSGVGTFAPSTAKSCLVDGWSGGRVSLSLSDAG
jgi:hypothetical protein